MNTKQLAAEIYKHLRKNGDFAMFRDLRKIFGEHTSEAMDVLAYEQHKVIRTRGVGASVEVW